VRCWGDNSKGQVILSELPDLSISIQMVSLCVSMQVGIDSSEPTIFKPENVSGLSSGVVSIALGAVRLPAILRWPACFPQVTVAAAFCCGSW
jgi:hypothetical protein